MADNRVAYGLAKKYGTDTTGMSPKEVWEALNEKGIKPDGYDSKASVKTLSNRVEKARKEKDTDETEKSAKNIKFNKPPSKTFVRNMTEAKNSVSEEERWRVDIHSVEDYKKDKLFTTEGGSCVAVEPNGNIISVCKRSGDTARGTDLVKYAVQNGGNRLDAFGGKLYEFYTKNGFEPVSWTPFNEEYAPDGWNKNRDKKEPVIFYKYTGKHTKLSYDDFINSVKPSEDYDTAMIIRDREIKK